MLSTRILPAQVGYEYETLPTQQPGALLGPRKCELHKETLTHAVPPYDGPVCFVKATPSALGSWIGRASGPHTGSQPRHAQRWECVKALTPGIRTASWAEMDLVRCNLARHTYAAGFHAQRAIFDSASMQDVVAQAVWRSMGGVHW